MTVDVIQVRCPACEFTWDAAPTTLDAPESTFRCPDCGETRRLSEFMWTDRDLSALRATHGNGSPKGRRP